MHVDTKYYTGNNGVYASLVPDYQTTQLLSRIVRHTHPPFPTHTVSYMSHVTVVCSDKELASTKIPFPKRKIATRIKRVEYWTSDGKGTAVFVLDSPLFKHVHSLFIQRGARHRHSEYVPHLSLALNLDLPEDKAIQWADRSTKFVRQEKHILTFNRLKVRDRHF